MFLNMEVLLSPWIPGRGAALPRVHSSVLEIAGLCIAFLSRMTAFVSSEIAFCSLLPWSV